MHGLGVRGRPEPVFSQERRLLRQPLERHVRGVRLRRPLPVHGRHQARRHQARLWVVPDAAGASRAPAKEGGEGLRSDGVCIGEAGRALQVLPVDRAAQPTRSTPDFVRAGLGPRDACRCPSRPALASRSLVFAQKVPCVLWRSTMTSADCCVFLLSPLSPPCRPSPPRTELGVALQGSTIRVAQGRTATRGRVI